MSTGRRPTLEELQSLQLRFDKDRGFDFPTQHPPEEELSREERLRRIEYAALALSGEVGELANSIKKARRALWQGESPEQALADSRHELADVLAYLLKLSELLGVELDRAYLEKMSENCLRFPSRVGVQGRRVISIAGPSGSGKTTVARALATRFPTYLELAHENPHLRQLLENEPGFDAFANQQWFLHGLRRFITAASPAHSIVLDQEPSVVVHVYSRIFLDQGLLSPTDYSELLVELLVLESQLAQWSGRRVIVMLDAPAEVLHQRAQHRNGGPVPPLEWFGAVRERFIQFRQGLPGAFVVSTEELSPDEVVERVRAVIAEASSSP
jgi:NTP pyrophosphatase (non-canonical NTP hydrolase)/predicted ATPase